MTEAPSKKHPYLKLHIMLLALGLVLDQVTKYIAVRAYAFPNNEIDYSRVTSVIGEWLQFRLVYNPGAAFGMQPQKLIPFLHPTLFFTLISVVAIFGLGLFYHKMSSREEAGKLGLALIGSGALGNLMDRVRIHKVVDFIDVGVPGVYPRWPTFNVADSLVCIGVGIILLYPLLQNAVQKFLSKKTPNQSPVS